MKIVKTSKSDKYWVVRPGTNYTYGKHFFDNGVIAIGHMDCVKIKSEGTVSSEDLERIEDDIRSHWESADESNENISESTDETKDNVSESKDETNDNVSESADETIDNVSESADEEDSPSNVRSASSVAKDVNMTKTFIGEMKIGDTIISPYKEHILIGTVISSPYVTSEPVVAFTQDGKEQLKAKLTYKLRRKVKWERMELKGSMPWMIQKSLGSAQAVYSLNHHKKLLEHWLYSVFLSEDGLHFSTRITKKTDISQFHIAEFQRFVQKLELTAAYIVDNKITVNEEFAAQLDIAYFEYGNSGQFTLTTKQSFTSPGNIWSEISGPELRQKVFAILLLQSFNVYGATANLEPEVQQYAETIKKVALELSTVENFESHRKHIGADIDKVRKTKINTEELVTEDAKANKIKAAFPSKKEETEVGV